ncbi:hypothetical protein PVL29_022703 [Vitis rotundifolia]|uniref:Uncharacterized protein n=1 Tax=Vitis rotundifolia TaxID=103349 RepID=A0AA39DAH7_VITRO|nr:hypothetical protein PVL29_022703 [Vitis rotundifolia]
MKKRQELQGHDQDQLEILKAVAQAWHGHSGSNNRPTNEFDAYKRNFKSKPSRFKLEAISKSSSKDPTAPSARWDFGQSLWDSYEIVTVSKRLEVGLALDDPIQDSYQPRVVKRRKESKNSLRNLFTRVSSKRFKETDIPPEPEDEAQF